MCSSDLKNVYKKNTRTKMQEQKRKNEKKYLEFNGGCGRKNREGEGGRRRLREGEGPKEEEQLREDKINENEKEINVEEKEGK